MSKVIGFASQIQDNISKHATGVGQHNPFELNSIISCVHIELCQTVDCVLTQCLFR